MDKLKIARINELYKKSKTEGLTETEKEEQKQLRNEYRMAVINNLHSSLNNVSIENEDGTITELKIKVITKEIRKYLYCRWNFYDRGGTGRLPCNRQHCCR